MILDTIKNAAIYRPISPGIRMALDYLATADFSGVAAGRIDLDGDKVFALVQDNTTRPLDQCVWEAHRRYLDVQFMIHGVERMGCAQLDGLQVTQPYDAEKDCVLLSGAGDLFSVGAGSFAVFFPQDAHMPGVALKEPAAVRKVVVKVEVEPPAQ